MRVLYIIFALAVSASADAQLSRSDVVMLYHAMYRESRAVPADWTGDIASCNAGSTSAAYQQAAIDVINYYRLLAGLPDNISRFTDQKVAQVHQAALMMAAQNSLSHNPGSGWACYSSGGRTAAGKSNLALGTNGINAIDLYMDDWGGGNYFVGHRRWILSPVQSRMASGSVSRANALWVLGPFGGRTPTPNGVAWPPAGFVPYDLLPNRSNRWSFSYPNADFSAASVTMTGPTGAAMSVTLENQLNDAFYADNTLVWRPNGASYSRPSEDQSYRVTVSNVRIGGQARNFSYEVVVIDPDAVVIEPDPPLFTDSFE